MDQQDDDAKADAAAVPAPVPRGQSACQLPSHPEPVAPVLPEDRLFVPHRKRLTRTYRTNEDGARELHIYYRMKQVTFDEERLFAFGEQLGAVPFFIAQDATRWGPGYPWSELAPLLETLLQEGVLQRGEEQPDPRGVGLVPSPLTPSRCPVPRFWATTTSEAITQELGGRPVELGYLETVLSVYRVAHPALDADERQVGEANVYPPGLRLDRETEWRACQYPGSRYRAEGPMNITALKAMIKHWKPILRTLGHVRAAVRAKCPRSQQQWTVGDLHTLAAVVLTLPAYQLMKGGGAVPQPPLHPVLSSLFRITDGVQMTTHSMLFLSSERTRHPTELVTAQEFHDFADHNGLFFSDTGVCAGPRALIDEFLAAVFEGEAPGAQDAELPAEVADLLTSLPEIMEYALLGLQVWAVTRSVWLDMSRAYEALMAQFEQDDSELGQRLRARLGDDWVRLEGERIALEEERDVHAQVYVDCYEEPGRALRAQVGPATLAEALALAPRSAAHDTAEAQLGAILSQRLQRGGVAQAPAVAQHLARVLLHYLRVEQAVLARAQQLQHAINALLRRPAPAHALEVRDFRVGHKMQGGVVSEFPYLFDTLEEELGLQVRCTADRLEIVPGAGTSEPTLRAAEPSYHAGSSAGG